MRRWIERAGVAVFAVVALLAGLTQFYSPAPAKDPPPPLCAGAADCTLCRDCRLCGHCADGGTCGACRPTRAARVPPAG